MPAAITSIGSFVRADFAVLSLAPPGAPRIPFGILLRPENSDDLEWKLLEELDQLDIPSEDREYVSYLDSDFTARVREVGGAAFFTWLEDTLNGFLILSEREAVSGRSVPHLLSRLFYKHVDTRVIPFQTHIPFYALRAAATRFGEDSEVPERDPEWVRLPSGLRASPDLFVVQVVGRSMEPLIPDNSKAIFRRIAAGSRQGKRLLIEELSISDTSARFTVKRYTSTKRVAEDGEWAHEMIRLEPLNREFPAFELDPEAFEGKYRVIGEFVRVLETGADSDADSGTDSGED